MGMKAVIHLDVPEWQIGQECSVYFRDSMMLFRAVCEAEGQDESESMGDDLLLKEQEPLSPRKVRRYVEYSETAVSFITSYDCGNCGAELPDNAKYCSKCGRAVKWDADGA